jgi:Mce-associated membrane protein
VTAVTETDSSAASPTEAAQAATRRRRPPWLVIVLTVVLVVALVGIGLLWKQNRDLAHDRDLRQAQASATDAASQIAVSMTSYDSRSVDKDFAWVHDDGTAKFEKTYAKSTAPIRKLIERTGAHAEGRVSEAAGTVTDPTHVTVVLFVDQTLRRTGDSQPSVDSSRVVMDMVRTDGQWLVDSVELR